MSGDGTASARTHGTGAAQSTDALHERDAVGLARMLREKRVSAREVVTAHLDRIAAVNPRVNAVVTLCAERALEEATAADELLASGAVPGPLHGLPVAVKDTHATAGVRTTLGSPVFAHHVPEADDLVVERMRAAGAIVVGKTNVPEFAAGSHTFNPVFGTTRNPYDASRSAGGSSGGAAAALAAGMHPIADGSDMGGSLRNPASFTNVVGLRPSPGRVPAWPSAMPWETLSTPGPMGRSVADAALLLSVIAGPDPRAPTALGDPGRVFADPWPAEVRGARVAVAPDFGGALPVAPEAAAVVTAAARTLEGLGAAVEEAVPDFSGADGVFRTLRAWQFHLAWGPVIEAHPGTVKEAVVRNAAAGAALTGEQVGRAKQGLAGLYHRFRLFFERYDLLLLPVSQVPPFDAGAEYPAEVAGRPMGDYLEWMASCYWVSATGCPALSVPGGFTGEGLPVGVQMVGPHRAERRLLGMAAAFEAATGYGRRRPGLS
ncbi:amidase [Nocardiopsis halophila]|uniref:amidase n=1 Tax=Nocardiopsis halophila TaxID=141692 RepID=UPI000349D7FD|nr:amidase [Nocardiopsis halophila]